MERSKSRGFLSAAGLFLGALTGPLLVPLKLTNAGFSEFPGYDLLFYGILATLFIVIWCAIYFRPRGTIAAVSSRTALSAAAVMIGIVITTAFTRFGFLPVLKDGSLPDWFLASYFVVYSLFAICWFAIFFRARRHEAKFELEA